MSNTPHETLITIDKVELDLWADIYCKARLASLIDVTLSEFLQRPYEFLKESGQASALDCLENGFFPMMPAQVKISRDIQRAWEGSDKKLRLDRQHLQLVHSSCGKER
ncbi:hypothetical protein M5G27_29785 [Pseudomonas shahriarae]|jgi:hypothetical protein|uniref:Uncharacterized protein n=1 Tax=Pseudomonas shahriarae TaxID=2745512 RepID=A0A9X4C7D1_9PSED|nr:MULTISPECIES: hypothetical protein [Pseudomonas]KNH45203.1 hypothetical protein ACS73_16200 [Pseudomonas lini]MDD1011651.1 hypothetical protein [Pseudomonas shahriarae]